MSAGVDPAAHKSSGPVIALSGGVGGAKLVLGLANILAPEDLVVIANCGDDFVHLGLTICPDIDTVTYTLAGLANPELGWGRAGETWSFMAAFKALGGEDWFNLGDGDLALHVARSGRLATGEPLSAVTADLCRRLGIAVTVRPMSDDPVRTIVETADGPLAFQHYFVRDRCQPAVTGFHFDGIEEARPDPMLIAGLAAPETAALIIAPSNPFVSVDPILALPGVRDAIGRSAAPVIAVSPIVGGDAIKGPAAKMMRELAMPATAAAVAGHYQGLLDGFVLDQVDADQAAEIEAMGMAVLTTNTIMKTLEDRIKLAEQTLEFGKQIKVEKQ